MCVHRRDHCCPCSHRTWHSAYLLSSIGGFIAVHFYLKWKPDARYLMKDKIDGTGYVWIPLDGLAPYPIFGALFLVISLVNKHR